MVNFEFRPLFRTKEERTEKRREQVRRAQKTFRERRDQYLKLLERQLGKFHAENAILIADAEQLRSDVSALQRRLTICEDALQAYQLGAPDYEWPGSGFEVAGTFLSQPTPDVAEKDLSPGVGIGIQLDYLEGKPHQLIMTPSSLGSPQETFTNFSTPNLKRAGTTKQKKWLNSSATPPPSRYLYKAQFIANLDTVVVAMEFVLKLESPCLPHIHDPSLEGTDEHIPQGHMHLASATILSCISNNAKRRSAGSLTALPTPQDKPVELDRPATVQSFSCPRSILARLLQRSEELPKESQELTPVQAWHQIEQHPDFGRINVAELGNLTEKLLEHIKCYGFGGVIKQEFLQSMLQEL